jgi:Family of unknown function (DUF6088)
VKTFDLINALDKLPPSVAAYGSSMLRSYFPGEDSNSVKKSLQRMVQRGVLERVCRCVYVEPKRFASFPFKLEAISSALRTGFYSYVSLESALAEYGVISQLPIDYLTVMTTGRSQTFKTPYGTIEFTHTQRHESEIIGQTMSLQGRPLRLALVDLAYADLKRVGRNLNLVNVDELAKLTH